MSRENKILKYIKEHIHDTMLSYGQLLFAATDNALINVIE